MKRCRHLVQTRGRFHDLICSNGLYLPKVNVSSNSAAVNISCCNSGEAGAMWFTWALLSGRAEEKAVDPMLTRKAEDGRSERSQRNRHVSRSVWACRGPLWYQAVINCSGPSAGLPYPPPQEAPLRNRPERSRSGKSCACVCEMFEQVKYWKMPVVCLLGSGAYTIGFDWFTPLKGPPPVTCCHGFPRSPGRVGLTRSEATCVQISTGTCGCVWWTDMRLSQQSLERQAYTCAHTHTHILVLWYQPQPDTLFRQLLLHNCELALNWRITTIIKLNYWSESMSFLLFGNNF